MRDEAIIEVGVDTRGRLFVRPADTAFNKIFRAAMGVDWDDQMEVLVSPEPREWSLARWFEQILAAAADEYGVALKITPLTKWSSVAPELQRDIDVFSNSDWLSQLLSHRTQNDARYWREHQLKEALSQAEQLWAEEQYADYVRILAPHRNDLSLAQQKRLTIAEHRADG